MSELARRLDAIAGAAGSDLGAQLQLVANLRKSPALVRAALALVLALLLAASVIACSVPSVISCSMASSIPSVASPISIIAFCSIGCMPCTPLGRVVIGHGNGFGGDEIPGVRMDVVGDGGWWGKDEW